jgi:hypothetical protein
MEESKPKHNHNRRTVNQNRKAQRGTKAERQQDPVITIRRRCESHRLYLTVKDGGPIKLARKYLFLFEFNPEFDRSAELLR